MEAVDVRGRFVWQQLMTRDVPGARKFYSRLMGWKTQPWPPDPSYTVCLAADVPVAGIMEIPPDLPAETPSHWLEYIGTRDVDGTADAAVRAGGSIIKPPSDMQGAGRYAVLKDPQGALFAIIDPENARPEVNGTPPLGAFSWHELATSDHEAAFAFYSGLFGWDAISRMDMGPAGVYLIFGANGVQRGGMYIKPPDWPAAPHWMPYGHVPSVDDSVGELESAGAKVLTPPMEVPGGSRVTSLFDPSGATFALNSFPAQDAAAPKPKPKPKAKAKAKAKAKPAAKPKAKVAVRAKAAKKRGTSASKTVVKAARKAGRKLAKAVKVFTKAAKKRSAAFKKSASKLSKARKSKSPRRKK
ncbi:MAG TPA: VOC family protein [Steroidobacteraceae bacterium]|nr:VOC family protein [Steroidobacteraceae bacterium]